MNSRRTFLKATGAALVSASASGSPNDDGYKGSHAMPTNVVLLSIKNSDGTETLGVKTAEGVIDVRHASGLLGIAAPLTLEELLKEGNSSGLTKLITAAGSLKGRAALLNENDIQHGRLFTNPEKIICIGLNYKQHAKEVGMKEPTVPILFNKYNNSLAAHGATIKLPPKEVAYKFDYETELLVVMGKQARNVSEDSALDYVAGYCTSNDFSARDLQLELDGHQWMIGKTLDDFAPIGPYFVCADLVEDPNNLNIECRVNGETRQHSNTSSLVYNTDFLVSYISRHFPLEPGDLIFTGTPPGVILGMPKEKQVWLKAGDQIACSVGDLGELRFTLA